jgi:hypothetical protein
MNKRVDQLIGEMGNARLPYGDNEMALTEIDLRYFAKLVIQECIAQCHIRGYLDPLYEGKSEIASAIEKHFGVVDHVDS